ncbi:MAG TPA: ABC transporter substrate-binding protein [Nitrospirota bacterium]|nr:ABC transporter substrate-binding protein [Nitrospirota bacterium]
MVIQANSPEYKRSHGSLGTSILLCALVGLLPVSARTADGPITERLEKVTIVYGGISAGHAPLWMAHEAGLFRKHGLDVQIVFVEGGSSAVQTLLSGDVAFAQMAGAAPLQSQLRGSDVVMIAGLLNTMPFQFVVARNIKRPEQLKGKALAVSRFGSGSDFATRYALNRYGLVPEKDVTLVEIGSQPARFAALEKGRVHGVMVQVPYTLLAKKMGFNILADLRMLGLEYQHTALATTRTLIKSRSDLVRNVIKAYVESIHYYKTHRKEALATLRKYLKTDDTEALKETYEAIGLGLLPEKPYPTLKGIDVMLREMAAKETKAQTAHPEQFVELTFLKELDSSGFIDRLYDAKPVNPARQDVPGTDTKTPPAQDKAKPNIVTANKPTSRFSGAPDLPRHYTVTAGDTLGHLALRFYGSSYKWPKIYRANAQTMKNPDYIYIGQELLIPADQAEIDKKLSQQSGQL